MKPAGAIRIAGNILLAVWTVVILCGMDEALPAVVGLIGLNAALSSLRYPWHSRGGNLQRAAVMVAWMASVMTSLGFADNWLGAALLLNSSALPQAFGPLIISAAIALSSWRADISIRTQWIALASFWLILDEFLWLVIGYCQNSNPIFYTALSVLVVTLWTVARRFQFKPLAAQIVNTVVLLLVGLPIADFALRIRSGSDVVAHNTVPGDPRMKITMQNARQYYSFDESHGNPTAFALWWHDSCLSYVILGQSVMDVNPTNRFDFRLRPNSHGILMDGPVWINSLGFRGKELVQPKGLVYRIVAIGESTTFGMTYRKDDKPWPELLEQMIRDRIQPSRPVEVVNAGVPGADLSTNLLRLRRDILPLKPDLIISYHGFNGFRLIDSSLPPIVGKAPPEYAPRPIKLAADIEYRIKCMLELRRYRGADAANPVAHVSPMQSRYADAYRELISFASTNHIGLALANFSMAANEYSDPRVIDFYRAIGPAVLYAQARANVIHSRIVRRLTEENPGVIFIDTHPHLDGDHEKFVDLVHFTQEGRQQLAENIFDAIRSRLIKDLARPTQTSNRSPERATNK